MCKCMECYRVTMDFSLSAAKRTVRQKEIDCSLKIFSFELIFPED